MGGQFLGPGGAQNLNQKMLLFLQVLIPHCMFSYIETQIGCKGGNEGNIVCKTID
jgi:hypothetical protein